MRRFVTTDVFTNDLFSGNPLAVVLDAEGLTSAQMQAVTKEFNYSETTFVLPPRDPAHAAQVRIFTPLREIPFAGHPNVGTAFVLARELATSGRAVPGQFVFEEEAGLVPVSLLRGDGSVVGAEFAAPEPLSRRGQVSAGQAAACLSLDAGDVRTDAHAPQVVSVGLPFLAVELETRDALRRAQPNPAAMGDTLPLDGAHAIYTYTRRVDAGEATNHLQSRMFMPGMAEDPATGSATAAVAALIADLRGEPELRLHIGQGTDMGRPSLLMARVVRNTVFVGGHCAVVMEGTLLVA